MVSLFSTTQLTALNCVVVSDSALSFHAGVLGSNLQIVGNPYCAASSANAVIVCAIGNGSQIPLASINI